MGITYNLQCLLFHCNCYGVAFHGGGIAGVIAIWPHIHSRHGLGPRREYDVISHTVALHGGPTTKITICTNFDGGQTELKVLETVPDYKDVLVNDGAIANGQVPMLWGHLRRKNEHVPTNLHAKKSKCRIHETRAPQPYQYRPKNNICVYETDEESEGPTAIQREFLRLSAKSRENEKL